MSIFDYWPLLMEGLGATISITVTSFLIGLAFAIPVAALRRSRFALLRSVSAAYVELVRGLPPLAWLFIAYFGLPEFGIVLEPLEAAIWVFSFISTAYLAEIYRAGLRAVPQGQSEASTALGLNLTDRYTRVIAPQAIRTVIPLGISFFIALIKDSAAASVIGVVEITGRAIAETRLASDSLPIFLGAATLYLSISIPIGLFGRWVARRLKTLDGGRSLRETSVAKAMAS